MAIGGGLWEGTAGGGGWRAGGRTGEGPPPLDDGRPWRGGAGKTGGLRWDGVGLFSHVLSAHPNARRPPTFSRRRLSHGARNGNGWVVNKPGPDGGIHSPPSSQGSGTAYPDGYGACHGKGGSGKMGGVVFGFGGRTLSEQSKREKVQNSFGNQVPHHGAQRISDLQNYPFTAWRDPG